jgi:hypothetical protein
MSIPFREVVFGHILKTDTSGCHHQTFRNHRVRFEKLHRIPYPFSMNQTMPNQIAVVHNKAPNRIRLAVPMIKHKQTLAELLKQSLLKDEGAKGVYHAEPNVVTGTLLVKYHPAFHTEEDVIERVRVIVQKLGEGGIEISAKHKNPRIGKMLPKAFFTRELIVSVFGNVIAGIVLAAILSG